ncbi:pilus assembly protein, ATPase [Candidatus Scalindua japonica]|uniref:Pilus assembly protein, ATPase n=1 Tax=Candidatus Scalindua japonica TaxID=1284222 RepID=A0A286TYX6_9BACT|nr:type IV pilus assembly protein PilM [Candidatus Scalindua japonica]GAX61080.1 pilus assembly protein, ATPase [Candidatus Scalindua japonica]
MLKNKMFSSISKKSKGKRLIGLDIGNYSVKALGVNVNGTDQKIECLAISEVPVEARQNGRNPEVLTGLIKNCLAEGRIVDKDVVIMVSGSQVFIRRITLPPMPEEELDEVVPFEVQKYVSIPVDKMAMDYMIVGEKNEDGVNKLDVILVAAPKELVEQEFSIARAAGLKPVAVTVAPLVQWKTLALRNNDERDKVSAMVDIGYERTVISFFNNGVLEFTRTINLGGNDVTKSLISAPISESGKDLHTLSYDDADALKREYGFPSPTERKTTEGGIQLSQLSMLMMPVLEKLLSEIRTSFDFYTTEFHISNVEKISMSGGGCELQGLRVFLSSELGIEVESANPIHGAEYADGISEEITTASPSALVTVYGLAVWNKEELNLLHGKKKNENKSVASITALTVPSGVAAMVMFFLYLNISGGMVNARSELEGRKKELSSLAPANTRVLLLSSKKRKLLAERDLYPQVLREDIDTSIILKEIRLHTADNIRLEYIRFLSESSTEEKKKIMVTGTAFFLDKRGSAISEFMTALEDSIQFDDVRLIYLEQDKDYTSEGLKFQISCLSNTI